MGYLMFHCSYFKKVQRIQAPLQKLGPALIHLQVLVLHAHTATHCIAISLIAQVLVKHVFNAHHELIVCQMHVVWVDISIITTINHVIISRFILFLLNYGYKSIARCNQFRVISATVGPTVAEQSVIKPRSVNNWKI